MVGLKRLEWNPVITIGPWKTNEDSIKQFFDASQGNLVIMDMSEHHENITEAERLDLLGDWEATRSVGKIQSDLENPDESKSWEVAQTMSWRPVAALPMRTYDRYYRHLGGVASSSFTTNFMGTSVPAVSLLGKTFGGSEKVLEQWEPWNDLLIVMQFQG
eukprot:jgi/Tetstr1/432561/TSEL_021932.t1